MERMKGKRRYTPMISRIGVHRRESAVSPSTDQRFEVNG